MSYKRHIEDKVSFWNKMASSPKSHKLGQVYRKILNSIYARFTMPNLRVLELGCGTGDLLASVRPSYGVGVDISKMNIEIASSKYPDLKFVCEDAQNFESDEVFDVIIISNLISEIWDIQGLFQKIKKYSHDGTRIIMNYYSNMWRPIFAIARAVGIAKPILKQSWLATEDIEGLLGLEGFSRVKCTQEILFPFQIAFLTKLFNRYLVKMPVFRIFALTNFFISRPNAGTSCQRRPELADAKPSVSIVVAARNEQGNIQKIFKRLPQLGSSTELIIVEGGSTDDTYEEIVRQMSEFTQINARLFKQTGKGKGDAVRLGFSQAKGDILMILDADMTMPPEELPKYYNAIVEGKGEFINGVRLVYPMEDQAMRFFNLIGNKTFGLLFSWILGTPIKDTLCGTKVLWRSDYEVISENRDYFGDFDPFGDFDLIFGASRLNLKIVDLPIRYHSRGYGETNISRWKHGWLLLRMTFFAARKIKFV